MQLGEMITSEEPPEHMSDNLNRAVVTQSVSDVGFESMHTYEESHCGFTDPWSFLAACRSKDSCRGRWYAGVAEVEGEMHRRMRRRAFSSDEETEAGGYYGGSILRYFDGATMASYQYPPRSFETVHCRARPEAPECRLGLRYDSNQLWFGPDSFEVGRDDGILRAKTDMPIMSYIKSGSRATVLFSSGTVQRIFEAGLSPSSSLSSEVSTELKPVHAFIEEFGIKSSMKVSAIYPWTLCVISATLEPDARDLF